MKEKSITLPAYAKINIYLDVREKRADGYHNIESLMQTFTLCDTVSVTVCDAENTVISSVCLDASEHIPSDENLTTKAARVFLAQTGIENKRIDISTKKRTPSQAGLGGGSSDAAATLVALNRLFETGLSEERLCEIGARVGADVPFLISGGTAFVTGIGEIIERTDKKMPRASLLVAANRAECICTKDAYGRIDEMDILGRESRFEEMKKAFASGSLSELARYTYNIFEEILPRESVVFKIKDIMRENGAAASLMSGSGSAVFGIFEREADARRAAQALAALDKDIECGIYEMR